MDLRQFAKTEFYAGPPEKATENELVWNGVDYQMRVLAEDGALVAVMTSGNMEWRTHIGLSDLKGHIDAALEDACNLGRIANYSSDE